ncbi:MAG: DHH family phosphoesterase, partial [Planctomycetota bacterium]|nr:DHH family phosphoesterase [Planctomycetota bacterium]
MQSTVALFVGGNLTVRVYTADPDIDDRLALYPGVQVSQLQNDYAEPPADLPDCPYFICVDKEDLARQIRSWLPKTLAVFHLATERKGRNAAAGFLAMATSQSSTRRRLMRRLGIISRVDRLIDMARGAELPLILMYGDPDPDAIGAALGLAAIWRLAGVSPIIRYTGEIVRYQNKLLITYLKEPIERLRDGELDGADITAVVDAQPGFWKNDPPLPQVIIDHHPILDTTQAPYLDLRENYGSTASIITEYLQAADITIKKRLATALLYGLITDTGDLHRNVHSADIKALDALYPKADQHYQRAQLRAQRITRGLG